MVDIVGVGDIVPTHPIADGAVASIIKRVCDGGVALANLETTLTEKSTPSDKDICFRSDPLLASEVRGLGFDVMTVANNHALDFGYEGLVDTVQAVRGAGMGCVGAGSNLGEALTPYLIERSGLSIAFVGFASTLPNGSGAGAGRPGIAPIRVLSSFLVDTVTIDEEPGMAPLVKTNVVQADLDRMTDALIELKSEVDVLVVTCHWGVPPGFVTPVQGPLADYQRPLAHALIEAGADVIIGHHPHALQGVEFYRERPIFYSLGNYLFHPLGEEIPIRRSEPTYREDVLHGDLAHVGGIASLTWHTAGPPSSVRLVPVHLDGLGEPELDQSGVVLDVIGTVKRHCAELGTAVSRGSDNPDLLTYWLSAVVE